MNDSHVDPEKLCERSPVAFYVIQAHYQIKTFEQANFLSEFLSEICPNKMLTQMGLNELFCNAIEHGNLGITSDEKINFQKEGHWLDEIKRRLTLPEHQGKVVNVYSQRSESELKITIKDDGNGFDWQKYKNNNKEPNKTTRGRGILMATELAFTSLEYAGCGNEVTATIKL